MVGIYPDRVSSQHWRILRGAKVVGRDFGVDLGHAPEATGEAIAAEDESEARNPACQSLVHGVAPRVEDRCLEAHAMSPRISNPNGPLMRPRQNTSTALWLRNAARDEVLFAARTQLLADEHRDNELELVRLGLSINLDVTWGEDLEALRARIIWRSRWFYRVMPAPNEPPVKLRWFARVVARLPMRWRPSARRFVDWTRRLK
jgi:hypothetical protein